MSTPSLNLLASNEDRKNYLKNLLFTNNIITTASLEEKNLINQNQIRLLEAYKKVKEDCDKKAYSVKWLDDIGDQITDTITPAIEPIIRSVQRLAPAAKSLAERAQNIPEGFSSVTASIKNKNRFYKIAKFNDLKFNEIKIIEEQILLLASEEGIYAKSLEELSDRISFINKKAGNSLSLIGQGLRGLGKGIGGAAAKSIPFLGISADLTLMCKNIYEAWQNGKKIILELPLDEYGISYNEALIPTPINTAKISKKLKDLSLTYKNSPNDLSKILNISQTLNGYGTDFVSTITNLLLTILDILEFTGLGLLVSFVISMPIMAVELANDILVNESYTKVISSIKNICDQKILELNKKIETEELSENISESQKDLMRRFLQKSITPEASNNKEASGGSFSPQKNTVRLYKLNNFMKVCS